MTTGDQNHEYALAIIERKHAEILALIESTPTGVSSSTHRNAETRDTG